MVINVFVILKEVLQYVIIFKLSYLPSRKRPLKKHSEIAQYNLQ